MILNRILCLAPRSGSTSLRSSIVEGLIENGRRYQSQRDNDISFPSDEKQFEVTATIHLAYTVIEALQDNPYFRSPLSDKAQHIIDLGTGDGSWPVAVADRFPNSTSPSQTRTFYSVLTQPSNCT